jgi:hypothetical protein
VGTLQSSEIAYENAFVPRADKASGLVGYQAWVLLDYALDVAGRGNRENIAIAELQKNNEIARHQH